MPIKNHLARALTCAGLLLSVSCQQGDLEVGQQIITPNELVVQLIDSFSVQTATVLADTFVTSADSSVLVGQWTDALVGRTLARGFASLAYAANDLPDRAGARFDSLVLVLPLGTAYGDTMQLLNLNVHRLTEKIRDKTYYNLNSVGYEPTPFLTKIIRPWPRSGSRQLRIRLPDAFSRTFYDKLRDRTIANEETFDAFLGGLAFVADRPTANLLLRLPASAGAAGLLLYYHESDLSQTRSTLRFPLQGGHFSQIATDRTNTPLQNLRGRTSVVSSRQTQNRSFVIAGAMLNTRLTIPSLDELALMDEFRGVNRAELIVESVRRNTRDNASPPLQLILYQTNSQNEPLAIIPDGTGSNSTAIANYGYDSNDLEQKGRYVFDVTYYINEVLKGRLPNRPLLLTSVTSTSQLPTERLTLGDNLNPAYRLRLKLYATLGK